VIENPSAGVPQPPTGDSSVEAVLGGKVDAAIVYCSYRDRYPGVAPGALTMVDFPETLQVGPEYALDSSTTASSPLVCQRTDMYTATASPLQPNAAQSS
jgi:hypothetical protein